MFITEASLPYLDAFDLNHTGSAGVALNLGDKKYDEPMHVSTVKNTDQYYSNRPVFLTADGIWNGDGAIELADNEIIITFELYEALFEANSKWSYVSTDLKSYYRIPSEIGKTFPLKFRSFDVGALIADYGEVKLIGVAFIKQPTSPYDIQIFTSADFCRKAYLDLSPSNILIQVSSVKDLVQFATTLRRDYMGAIANAGLVETTKRTSQGTYQLSIADLCYSFEQTMMLVSIMFFAVGIILLIVLILLVINLISFSIANRKKEIGILSAIGASNRDVTSIFMLETAILSTISFVIILVLAFVSAAVLNLLLSKFQALSIVIPYLRVSILTFAILAVLSFGLMLLAALIPIRKIIKLKPIDAIRVL